MQRTYRLPEGHAHATYDGSTWHVVAHPSNDPAFRDEACPLGGHSPVNGVAFEAWRDEAGFSGRQWRTGANTPDLLGSHNPIGMDDQWPSLTAIAEAAIEVAYDRVRTARVMAAAKEALDNFVESIDPESLAEAIETLEDQMSELPSTPISADEAELLLALGVPEGFEVMQHGVDDDEWAGLEEADEVDEDVEHVLMAATPAGDPSPIVEAMRQNNAVERFLCREEGVHIHETSPSLCVWCLQYDEETDEDGAGQHALGLHDDEAVPGCPTCDAEMEPPLVDRDGPIAIVGDPTRISDDPDWPADYAALGIQRDTWACVVHGSRKEAEPLVFTLLAQGREVRLARDPEDPDRWHLAVRGGMAGKDGPAVFVSNLRPEYIDGPVCATPMTRGGSQHPLVTEA